MPLAETGLYVSVTGVTFTPAGGAAIPIPNITNVTFGLMSAQIKFTPNGAVFPTHIKNVQKERTIKINGGQAKALLSVPSDVRGTLVWIMNDAQNGISTGAITFTLSNALLKSHNVNGQTNQYAAIESMWEAFSSDGTTDPLSIAVAPPV